jgi:hypothetical protein
MTEGDVVISKLICRPGLVLHLDPLGQGLKIKHLLLKGNKNCEIHGPSAPWGPRGGAKTIKINAIIKNLYSSAQSSQTVAMIVISIEPSTKIVKFMAPGSGVLVLGQGPVEYIVKVHYFLKYLLLNCYWVIRKQSKCIVMLREDVCSKIVNFTALRVRDSVVVFYAPRKISGEHIVAALSVRPSFR